MLEMTMSGQTGPRRDKGVKAIVRALKRRKASKQRYSSVVELAALLGLTKQAVSKWERVPSHHVLDIEKAIGVSRYIQRPDVYGTPRTGASRGRDRS